MTDFYCVKKDGKPAYDPSVEEEKRKRWESIPDGKTVNLPIVVPNDGKSWAQCKLIFGNMIANAVHQANEKAITVDKFLIFLLNQEEQKPVPIDKDFLHAFMYIISPTFSDDGNPITLSKMNKSQASRLFKVTQTFLAGMGIKIDDPPELSGKD